MRKSLPISLFLFALAGPVRAPAGEPISPHAHELLIAQLEDLQRRLGAPQAPEALVRPDVTVQVLPGSETRVLAAATVERHLVRLTGQASHLLRWLDLASSLHLVARPPLALRAMAGPGRPIQIEINLWQLHGQKFDPKADVDTLTRLRDTLIWLEEGQAATSALLALLDGMTDFETVRLEELTWRRGSLTGSAHALDVPSRQAYRDLVAQRMAAMAHPPELELQVAAAGAEARPDTLQLDGCPLADALLLAANLAGAELLVLAPSIQRLSLRTSPTDGAAVLAQVMARAEGLQAERFGAVHVLAPKLTPKPPAFTHLPEQPIALALLRASPGRAWRQVAAAGQTGILAPAGDAELTAVLRKRTVRQVAGMLAWAQGLSPHAQAGYTLLLPQDQARPAPLKPAAAGPVDLVAQRAPLTSLVEGLTGLSQVVDCAPDQPVVDLRLTAAQPAQLAADLLAVHGRSLRRDGIEGRLEPVSGASPKTPCLAPKAGGEDTGQTPALAAVLKADGVSSALLRSQDSWSWAAEDTDLSGGWRLVRLKAWRAVLTGPAGQSEHLHLQSHVAQGPRTAPSAEPGPTRQGLSDLRLAATALVPGTRPMALVADRENRLHRVTAGDPIGRRCGRVEAILPGALEIRLGCARKFEPGRVRMGIGAD